MDYRLAVIIYGGPQTGWLESDPCLRGGAVKSRGKRKLLKKRHLIIHYRLAWSWNSSTTSGGYFVARCDVSGRFVEPETANAHGALYMTMVQ